ncbi:transglutaminase family protein [Novosphingobium sp.]|uniref:transglutaminase-like domain-containing protein n=1 Tax=Novosphingobium sp. TaxID=1874826 RepID=UPI00286BE0F9|nr:transglutaminase family protein [Novosphingobium sp.]
MKIRIHARLFYMFAEPTDVLVQVEAAAHADQQIEDPELWLTPVLHFARVPGHDEIGSRIWLRVEGELALDYKAVVAVDRPLVDVAALPDTQPHLLPGDVIDYLMPSRFCPSDRFSDFVASEFPDLAGGALVAALRDWVARHLTYEPGASHAGTCASDTFIQRRGVCRDYAHLLITLTRAASIPARYASVYAPDVTPPDFHAVAEVWLGDAWHLVDATGMAAADEVVKIGVGRDAADIPFLSSFGNAELYETKVSVSRA